jgi:acetyl-CoA/propionyl-CoA carboxylase, biotin carboxylase, biotin carboxyl carrier protein
MKKLLIANRGEIAIRIIRAARDYNVAAVAIYSDADSGSLHAELADEAYSLGAGRPADTYLNISKILEIARRSGADAVHPGYGFLSERAEFAQAVIDSGLIWVGPSPAVITALGDKVQARRVAAKVGAPLVKGSDGPLNSASEAVAFAKEVGLPLAIKAAFGGGGRGMKIVRRLEDVAELFDSAVREATEAFGRGDCYAEQFLDRPRHIEAQIIADQHGNTVVLGTRDCSLQRRNQKLVEEAPAPFITDEQRGRIHEAAKKICAEAGYTGAGTVEFLLSQNGVISFLEVNTRLQVEHPVTEETTGVDIVIEQLRIADGLPVSVTATPEPRCHAIEFRINAEDPGRGFLPTPGMITRFRPPEGPGVRLDSGVETGSQIPGLYDSLMAKLIITGETRQQALIRARRALAEFNIEGVASVLPFHRAVLEEEGFTGDAGFHVYTNWIETEFRGVEPSPRVAPIESGLLQSFIEIDGKRHTIGLPASLFANVGAPRAAEDGTKTEENGGAVTAPVPGTLQQWLVEDGATVVEGDGVAIMEAMKMEMRIVAPKSGHIQIHSMSGSPLSAGEKIAAIE